MLAFFKPSKVEGGANRLVGVYIVPYSKTRVGEDRLVPLAEPPVMYASALHWYIIHCISRKIFSVDQARAMFDASFLVGSDPQRGKQLLLPENRCVGSLATWLTSGDVSTSSSPQLGVDPSRRRG